LILGTVLALTVFGGSDLRRIGSIPMGLPDFRLPVFSEDQLRLILFEGLILGLLGCIDSLLTAMIADSLTRRQHDSNRELIGQGLGNLVSGLFGGLPGAGATMGTVVNIQVGARSPWAGVLRAALLLLVVVALAPYLEAIPMAVLAAIACKVGFDILDWSFLKRVHRVSRTATFIMYGVLALTVFVDLVVAVGVGVFIANVLTIDRLSKLQSAEVRTITASGEDVPLTTEERERFDQAGGRVLLLHLSGPMIFGVANAIARATEQFADAAQRQRAHALIIDLRSVPILATTIALALENLVLDAHRAGLAVYVAGATGETRDRLQRIGQTGNTHLIFHDTRLASLDAALEQINSS
jgi:SulP family sulfate permease